MANKNKKAALWAEAQRKCRLSDEVVRMAKELGMGPRGLIKNIPNKSELWKAPVEEWVRELYQKRMEKQDRKARRQAEDQEEYTLADLGVDMEIERLIEEAETAGRCREEVEHPEEDDFAESAGELIWDEEDAPPSRQNVREENEEMLRRQRQFRLAAEYVANAFKACPAVLKVALIGSVAVPLKKEVPRFSQFRRAGIAIWHECRDIDLAVWVDDLDCLNDLRRAVGGALNELFSEHQIGVAHHQVDVFILEPTTDRYRGRLCKFGSCPKGKRECYVPGCGARPFLQQHRDFTFHATSLRPDRMVILWDRQAPEAKPPSTAPAEADEDDDIPF